MKKGILSLLLVLLAGLIFFGTMLRFDNKYVSALPGGWGFCVLQEDREAPAFLVDGWEIYPGELLDPEDFSAGRTAERYGYAGENANFSELLGSPYGEVTYRIVLKNEGEEETLSLYLPELLCAGRVYIGGALAGSQGSVEPYEPLVADGVYSFSAAEETEIVIQCANYSHYYSGLYYPPAVGTPAAIARMTAARLAVYGFLCFCPLAAALSSLAVWAARRDRLARRLGLLCLAFSARVCYPFLRALAVPLVRPLYALEDFCGALVLLCAVLIAGELSGAAVRWFHRKLAVPAAAALCGVCVVFPLFVLPFAPAFINGYGILIFVWRLAAGLYLIGLSVRALRSSDPLGRYLLCASGLHGLFAAISVLSVGYFEPIRGAWPDEYGGFLLAAGFAALSARRSMLISQENRRLTLHLQEEVERRTQAMETLLRERRELLGSVIHDLKNPLSAVRGYAELVRTGGVALDQEVASYLDALTERIDAVEERFGALQRFSRGERQTLVRSPISLNDFLRRFYRDNRPDMELGGQSFALELPSEELFAAADEKRLRAALENLCYNAVSFTPEDGSVTLSLTREEGMARIDVRDTGSGIAEENLPHLFEQGFTTRADDGGEGLGLFLVRSVALEHGGSAEASSLPGKGSVFTLRLPLMEE